MVKQEGSQPNGRNGNGHNGHAFARVDSVQISEAQFARLPQYVQQEINRLAEENARLAQRNSQLEKQATIDELTSITNRTGFNAEMKEQAGRMERLRNAKPGQKRDDAPVTLVLLDLDGFKSINDGLGHPVGDKALKEFAGFMKKYLRPGDVIARVGGDEFALLVKANEQETHKMVSRLRDRLVEQGFKHDDIKHYLSFSFGVRELTQDDEDLEKSAESIAYKEADGKADKDKKANKAQRRADYEARQSAESRINTPSTNGPSGHKR